MAGCSIKHKSHLHHVSAWVTETKKSKNTSKTFFLKVSSHFTIKFCFNLLFHAMDIFMSWCWLKIGRARVLFWHDQVIRREEKRREEKRREEKRGAITAVSRFRGCIIRGHHLKTYCVTGARLDCPISKFLQTFFNEVTVTRRPMLEYHTSAQPTSWRYTR